VKRRTLRSELTGQMNQLLKSPAAAARSGRAATVPQNKTDGRFPANRTSKKRKLSEKFG
jgi:hypothetical protein